MANILTSFAREAFGNGDIDWEADDIRAILVNEVYVYSASHDFLSDVPGGQRIGSAQPLTNKTNTGGVMDADDVNFGALSIGDNVRGAWLYVHTGVEATSGLVHWFDRSYDGTLIDFTTDGTPVRIIWPNTGDRIFKL